MCEAGCLLLNLLALHACQISTYSQMIIKNSISFTNDYWKYSLNVPFDENKLDILMQRVRIVHIFLGDVGSAWLQKMEPYMNESHQLTNLYNRLTLQEETVIFI